MRRISIVSLLQYGMHDSVIKKISFDFQKKIIEMMIEFPNNNGELLLYMDGLKSIQGIGFDEKNKIIILDYKICENEIQLFTTLSEWITISFTNIYIYIMGE